MDKKHNNKKGNINRRDFLKIMGAGTITATAVATETPPGKILCPRAA